MKQVNMSAYIVIEGTVRDKEALGRYGSQATSSIKESGGEVLAFGPWELIFGEGAYHNGMIVRFPDKVMALAWYDRRDLLAITSPASFRLDAGAGRPPVQREVLNLWLYSEERTGKSISVVLGAAVPLAVVAGDSVGL